MEITIRITYKILSEIKYMHCSRLKLNKVCRDLLEIKFTVSRIEKSQVTNQMCQAGEHTQTHTRVAPAVEQHTAPV